MGSSTVYSIQTQTRYIMQWFHEWSEMQRGDFMPVLAQKFIPSGYINGLVSGLDSLATSSGEDRPPSLFQCRVKLFKDWTENWNMAEKEQLLSQIKSADSTFATKFETELQCALSSGSAGDEITTSTSPEESISSVLDSLRPADIAPQVG